ncbi:sulfite exporter TauE/SafE family protein [Paracoccus sp. R12_1]|uniref:sulfite exporter TauE/SafE family protein n=1 Tax=unclassified Paracoccus (in: a-proteobacteria) TaxID=2688777 RepID=UPI001AD983E3|nr:MULTISPECIES: sulfite exporter TauE/SafE family protein [unclassified Paracoccus (in: a-proteobacteria)]MBO9453817.1 sulfite exporter TauE/SafE family protein [Paracoccus sp. R12_2]MBO9486759.1 sulfite exporter TauE/SafE family protein [Paracoccus sp. R12_1]
MFGLEIWQFWAVVLITLFAGFVKGAVGFAMPMIMLSAFGSILPATTALAALILPTLLTNVQQAFRQGTGAAYGSAMNFRWHIAMVLIFIAISAGFARAIPQGVMYAMLGVPIVGFALWQLSGRSLALPVDHRRRAEIGTGIIGGLYGGISGIWGPPLIVLLLSLGVDKREQVRVQGVVFLLGAVVLMAAHLASGVLNAQTVPLSAILCVPAVAGMLAGFALQDRLDVVQFRRWTLILLVLTGLNLVRRALDFWI